MKDVKIALNQINTVTGDLDGNYQKVVNGITKSLADGADIIVFPETAITAYCVGALWDNIDFIFEQEHKVKELIKIIPYNKALIIGYVSYHGKKPDGFPLLKNSVAVINRNKMRRYDKQLLANADHHEDRKYFKKGKKTKVFNLELESTSICVGIPICEDAWYTNHKRDIPEEMVKLGAELLIVPNQSYFYYHKNDYRKTLFGSIANRFNIPVLTLNSVGIGDIVKNIIIFDGNSMIFDENGNYVHKMDDFGEDYFVYGLSDQHIDNPPVSKGKYSEIIDALIFEQREFFRLLGIKIAQVHISGGVDSAIVAALEVLSMGKENCRFITNPTNLNSSSLPMAQRVAGALGVHLYVDQLEEIAKVFKEYDTKAFGECSPQIQKEIETVSHAVGRTVQGLAATHRFQSGIVATGNHTEIVLGWANFHDIGSIGVHMPLGDLTKLELFEISHELNNRFGYEVIPLELIDGTIKPAAQLPDANEDPIDYAIQSGLCAEVIRHRKTKKQLIDDFRNKNLTVDFFLPTVYENYTMDQFINEVNITLSKSRTSVFKAAQGAPIVIVSPRSRGFSNRETLINMYKNI